MATEIFIDGYNQKLWIRNDNFMPNFCYFSKKSGIKDLKFSNLYAYFEMPNAPVHQLVRVNGKCANPYF